MRAKKRARKGMSSVPPSSKLVEEALKLCRVHRLESDLDIIDIAHLRLTSIAAAKIAAGMATERMKSIRLDCLVMVDGKLHIDDIPSVNEHLIEYDDDMDCSDMFGREGIRATVYQPACGLMQLVPTQVSPAATSTEKNHDDTISKDNHDKKPTTAMHATVEQLDVGKVFDDMSHVRQQSKDTLVPVREASIAKWLAAKENTMGLKCCMLRSMQPMTQASIVHRKATKKGNIINHGSLVGD